MVIDKLPPELANANPDWFGISVVAVDGQTIGVGDRQQTFSLQSVSKSFMFGMALEDHGREHVLQKVSVEPTVTGKCSACNGTGKQFVVHPAGVSRPNPPKDQLCLPCGDSGKCTSCQGSGTVEQDYGGEG